MNKRQRKKAYGTPSEFLCGEEYEHCEKMGAQRLSDKDFDAWCFRCGALHYRSGRGDGWFLSAHEEDIRRQMAFSQM
jgi:hypothetical protein